MIVMFVPNYLKSVSVSVLASASVSAGAYPDCHDSGFVRDTSASCAAARFTTKLAAFHVIIIVNGI
jgi:hypothetical protein